MTRSARVTVTEQRSLEEGNLFAGELPARAAHSADRKVDGKIDSLRLLNDAIDSFPENAKQIADRSGYTESQFAKARKEAPGGGKLSELIDRLPSEIRHAYAERLGALDDDQIQTLLVTRVVHACIELLAHTRRKPVAKAGLR